MSKIEEMAKEAGYDGYHRAPFEKGFIRGANAVLKEIEKVFDISKPYLGNPFATLEERARGVYDLVKELKGE
jgi:hypothetical protein